jgi:hypothetical protein
VLNSSAVGSISRVSASLKLPQTSFLCPECGIPFDSRRRLAGHLAGKHRTHLGLKRTKLTLERLTESQRGYLAAFLDGEGGIQITESQRKDRDYTLALHPAVYFTNTNSRAILEMRSWLGGGSVTTRPGGANHSDMHILSICGVDSIRILLSSLRSLLIIKQQQADLMIAYCESRMSRYAGKQRYYTPLELRLYTAIKKLNRKRGGAKKRQPTDL